MAKIKVVLMLCWMAAFFLTACGQMKGGTDRLEELEYTVLKKEEVPEELGQIIEENKQGEIKMSYEDGGFTYLVRGYGEQKTGGYSIMVGDFYLASDGIHIETSLIGPSAGEKTVEEPSYPYLVLKTEQRKETIYFD